MPTRVVIQGPKPNRGQVMVQTFDPRTPLIPTSSPVVIEEGDEREFYVEDGVKALLVTEQPKTPAKASKR